LRRDVLRRAQTTDRALNYGQPGGAARKLRLGFTNLELGIALGLLAAVGLLLSLQSCPVSFGAGKAGSKQAAGGAGKTAASAPPLIPSPAEPLKVVAQRWVDERQRQVTVIGSAETETQQALGWMDPRAAANLLAQLSPPEAAALLTQLHRRQIALILEEADPPTAALWLKELLRQPALPLIPDEFKSAAARAGLYVDTTDELQKYRAALAQSGAGAGGGTEAGAATTPPASGQAGTATAPPAAGTATSPPAGATMPPATTTPAGGQAAPAGAAPAAAGAGGATPPAGTAPPATGNQTPSVPGGAQAPPGTTAVGP